MNKQFDSLWKSLIEDLFPEFLRFFYRDADKIFDLRAKFEFLDKELEKLYPDQEKSPGLRFVDKLVKVKLKSGGEQWILVHIEVQGYADKHFPQRMFTYFYRILDRYRHPVTAVAIFTGINGKTPNCYKLDIAGTKLEYRYNTYRVIDQPEEALKASHNPFALIVLAAKTALLSGNMTDEALISQHERIFKALQAKKLSQRKVIAVYAFLRDCIHFVDPKTYIIFDKKLEVITGKKDVMGVKEYLMDLGRAEGEVKGRAEGEVKGRAEGEVKGRAEGEEKGRKETKHEIVVNLIEKMGLSDKQVAEIVDVTAAFVKKVRQELKK